MQSKYGLCYVSDAPHVRYICRPRSVPKLDESAFPVTVGEVPLTVTLAMKACLTRDAAQRLTAAQMREVLADMLAEVASGTYVASTGVRTVRYSESWPLCGSLLGQPLCVCALRDSLPFRSFFVTIVGSGVPRADGLQSGATIWHVEGCGAHVRAKLASLLPHAFAKSRQPLRCIQADRTIDVQDSRAIDPDHVSADVAVPWPQRQRDAPAWALRHSRFGGAPVPFSIPEGDEDCITVASSSLQSNHLSGHESSCLRAAGGPLRSPRRPTRGRSIGRSDVSVGTTPGGSGASTPRDTTSAAAAAAGCGRGDTPKDTAAEAVVAAPRNVRAGA